MQNMLKQLTKIPKEIEIRKGYIIELRSKLDGMSGIDYSREKLKGGNNSPDDRIITLLNKIFLHEKSIEDLENEIKKIDQAINKITDSEERQIIILRYLRGYSWNKICDKLYISYATAKRRHSSAVKKLKIIYKNELP